MTKGKLSHFLNGANLGCLLLLLFACIPLKIPNLWLQGLPFNSIASHLLMAAVFPFLLVFHFNFIKSKALKALLLTGIAIKLFGLILLPSQGIKSNVFAIVENQKVKMQTYEGIWLKNTDYLIQHSLEKKQNFPADWINLFETKQRDAIGLQLLVSSYVEILDTVAIEFYGGSGLQKESKLTFSPSHSDVEIKLDVLHDNKLVQKNGQALIAPGLYFMSGVFNYLEQDWAFDFQVLEKNENTSLFDKAIFFQSTPTKNSLKSFACLSLIFTWLINVLIATIVFIWLYQIVQSFKLSFTDLGLAAFTFLFTLFFVKHLGNHLHILANLVVVYGIACLSLKSINLQFSIFNLITLILLVFTIKWLPQIAEFKFYSFGDDWLKYQVLARKIFIDGDWVNWGEQALVYQPLYRFFVGTFHSLFGQSSFMQQIFDVWCMLGIAFLLFRILRNTHLKLAFIAFLICLFIFLNPGYSRFIGSGLQEISAAFFMILTLTLVIEAQFAISKLSKYFFPGMAAVVAMLLRTDHLPVLLVFGLLLFHGDYRIKNIVSKRHALFYYFIVCASLGLLVYKVYNQQFTFLAREIEFFNTFPKIFILCSPKEEPFYLFKLVFALNLIGIVLYLINRKKMQSQRLDILTLGIAAAVVPYFIDVAGYIHRFGIHVLPLSILYLILCLGPAEKIIKSLTLNSSPTGDGMVA